jgi:NADH-quinone oxidoreductase subunit J
MSIYILGALAIFFAFSVVLSSHAITSALSLLVVFCSIAGLYAVMGAHFLAGLQILVYAGAVLVLFVFILMLIQPHQEKKLSLKKIFLMCAFSGFFLGPLSFIFLSLPLVQGAKNFSVQAIEQLGGNTQVLSVFLFSDGLFAFELVSFVLLVAIISTVFISKRNQEGA